MQSSLRHTQTVELIRTLESEIDDRSFTLASYHASVTSTVEKALLLWYAPRCDIDGYTSILEFIKDQLVDQFGGLSSRTKGVDLSISDSVLTVRMWILMASLDCCLELSTQMELLEEKVAQSEGQLDRLYGLSII